MSDSLHRFLTAVVGIPLFLIMVVMLSQRPATCLLILAICVPLAIRQRGRDMARQLLPAVDRVSAADRAAAAAVWRVLGTVFVVAGVVAGVAWYLTPGPLAPWMLAAYFAWGVIAYLILDHALDRRLRSGWLRNTARMLLTACFVWTLVAPWRLLGRLSDWYFERHPLGSRPMFSSASQDGDDEVVTIFNRFDEISSPDYKYSLNNIHHEW